jgi:acyl-CoA thioesterase FadM
MRSFGFDKQFIFNAELMFVVHSASSEFIKPARLDDELIATVKVIKSGKAYLLMEQNVYRLTKDNEGNELLCRAEVKLACVDKHSIRPRRIPAEMLSVLAG